MLIRGRNFAGAGDIQKWYAMPGLTRISEVWRGLVQSGLGELSWGRDFFTQYFTEISEQIIPREILAMSFGLSM